MTSAPRARRLRHSAYSCRFAVAAAGAALSVAGLLACSTGREVPPNFLVIVMDTARASRFSAYGYERPTTPRLDAFGAKGIRFARATSTTSWTVPSHASLFTGLLPVRHGATQEHNRLEPGPQTLAELLGAAGYQTLAVSGNAMVSRRTGLVRGFDHVKESFKHKNHRRSPAVADHPNLIAVNDFIASRDPSRPFFVFVNFNEAHGPYLPPEPYHSRFVRQPTDEETVVRVARVGIADYYTTPGILSDTELALLGDLYDGVIAYLDALVGGLLDGLERSGALDDTVVVLTADHGENIGDHGHLRHVFSLYNTTLRIPLWIRLPRDERAGEVRDEVVSLMDLFATILRLAGLEEPAAQRGGQDLLAPLDADRAIFGEYYYPSQALGRFSSEQLEHEQSRVQPFRRRTRSVEQHGLKLIWGSDGRHELYDLRADPAEQSNLLETPEFGPERRSLEGLLTRLGVGDEDYPGEGSARRLPAFEGLNPAEIEELRQLGYVR